MATVELSPSCMVGIKAGSRMDWMDPIRVGSDGLAEYRAYYQFDTVGVVPENQIVKKVEFYWDQKARSGTPSKWKHRFRFGQFLRGTPRIAAWNAPGTKRLKTHCWAPGVPRYSWINLGPRAVELFWNSEKTDLEVADDSTGESLVSLGKRRTKLRITYAEPDSVVQVLVCNRDVPGEPDEMRWKPGLPVVVRPDTWTWGYEEDPDTSSKFRLVSIPQLTRERLDAYFDQYRDDEENEMLRHFRFLEENMPSFARDELDTNGRLFLTWAQIRNFCKNRVTGGTV